MSDKDFREGVMIGIVIGLFFGIVFGCMLMVSIERRIESSPSTLEAADP